MLLRDYQIAATEAVFDYFVSSCGTPLVVLPTGSGKSICIADLVKHVLKSSPNEHCLILSHRQEILQQNAAKLQSLLPNTPIGIYSQGLGSKRLRQVTVAGVQSLVRVPNLPPFKLIIIDECHLCPPKGEGSYQKIISRLLAAEPDARIVGYSATPFRLGSGYLHEGEDRVFTDICFEVPVIDLVNAGYLSPLITKHANTQADLSGVAIRGGEFVAGQAEQAMDREELTGSAVAEMLRWGGERKSWLVFCSGIKHAEHVTQELIRAGVNADNLFGNSDKGHRTRVLNNFKNQRLRALVSVDTITTGFDAPCTDMIAFLRPTASAGLWVQALGRGMRISPETSKSNCLVLDFCGNAVRLGPIDNPRVSQRGGGKSSESREAPSKVCPECSTCVATATRSCVDCGYEWPEPEVIHAPVAYSSPVMSNGEPEIYEVRSVSYKKHSKNIGIDAFGEDKFSYSLRVIYSMGLGFEISEWICFGHEKEFARRQADRWWKQHRTSDSSSVPKTVEEAINRTSELMDVERITVKKDGKFYRVIATTFRVSAVTESLLEEHGI